MKNFYFLFVSFWVLFIANSQVMAQNNSYIPVYTTLQECNNTLYNCNTGCLTAAVWNSVIDEEEDLPMGGVSYEHYMSYQLQLQKSSNSTNTSWTYIGSPTTLTGTQVSKDYTVTQSGTYRIMVTAFAAPNHPLPATPQVQSLSNKSITIYKPVVANFKINNQSVNTTTVITTPNCNAITLSNTSTGTQLTGNPVNYQYKIVLTPTDANNNQLANTNSVEIPWQSSSLTSVDLRSLFPTLNTTTGYYRVELQAKNVCNGNTTSIKTGRINVVSPIPTSIATRFVDGAGVYNIVPGTSCTSAAQVGNINASFKFTGTTGEALNSYFLKIERFTSCSGNPTLVVDGASLPTTIPTGTNIVDIAIHVPSYIYQKTGTNSWDFSTTQIEYYKITATFTNPCGNTEKTFWVKNSGAWKTDPHNLTILPTSSALTVAPNPFSDFVEIDYLLDKDSPVSLRIVDLSGRVVAHPLLEASQIAGKQNIRLDGSLLPKGLYFYELQIGEQITTGKLLKLE